MLRSYAWRLLAPALLLPSLAAAQQPYHDAPAPIAQILDAPGTPLVSISPDRTQLALIEPEGLPPITEVAAPELRLAGLRINPRTSGPSRSAWYRGIALQPLQGGVARPITLPAKARHGFPQWSPTSDRLAFVVATDSALTLWVADLATGRARPLSTRRLNAALGTPCVWLGSEGKELLCRVIPATRAAPPAPSAPAGPAIQEAAGRAAPNRTYQDLLTNPADEALFDYYATSELVRIALDGRVTPLAPAGIYTTASPSPDGRQVLIQQVKKPYSYVVPVGRFPSTLSIVSVTGRSLRTLAELPLQDAVPIDFDAVTTGPRSLSWRAGVPAVLTWAEALDGGNPKTAAAKRDRVLTLGAPFTGDPQPLVDLEYRYNGAQWTADGRGLLREGWFKNRRTRTWLLASGEPKLLFDRSSEDRYNDPGFFLTRPTAFGSVVQLSTDGSSAWLSGDGASAEGDRPFLDQIVLSTGAVTRRWRSEAPYYEDVVTLLDASGTRVLTSRESVDEPPNYQIRDLTTGTLTPVTSFKDPAPQFAGLKPEILEYKRADGVALSAKMYLPPGYKKESGPLPFFLWAYPQEFKSKEAAAQVQGSPYRFERPSGADHLFLLTQGYGVLDGPTMPIIGEGDKEPNDTYVEQLVSSASAAVDEIVRLGVADRNRIGVGGHSYGAFMTANLLAHSSIFRAGIARSGAYNRTLTPFGFQSEERTYWQAPEVYDRMSPFTYADSIKTPLLLIHGEADNNSGTFPIQSERMFAAVKGAGGTVRLVMLPAESHGYRARESVGHTLYEMSSWLDRYLKPAATP